MKKLPNYIYVSPLMFLLFFFSWTMGKVYELLILYFITTMHEIAHIIVAKRCGLKVVNMQITPVGLNAKINFNSSQKYNEYIICLAGPLCNLVMAGLGQLINSYYLDKSNNMSFFVISNLAIFLLNILPVLPLDGGRIFKKVLLNALGYKYTTKILTISNNIFSMLFISLGLYQFINYEYNLSLLFIGIFLYTNMYKEKDEIQFALISELLYKKNKLIDNNVLAIENFACYKEVKALDVVKNFKSSKYHVIKIFDEKMFLIGEITENELLDGIIRHDINVTMGEVFK